jgi:hypothetical protein
MWCSLSAGHLLTIISIGFREKGVVKLSGIHSQLSAGHRVQLILHVCKFRCDTTSCPRKVFAERLGSFVETWARKTTRLREAIGLSTCGEGGARLADRLGMPTSPTTVLRCVMALPLPPVEPVSHLGIDDFALRRGRTSCNHFLCVHLNYQL